MAARFVSTSRLGNIIQMITLSHQTGILRVVRTQGQGQGARREMGQIRFVQGEPITALLGETTGGAALNALANWGECDYAFDTSADQDDSDPSMGNIGAMGSYPSSPASSPTSAPNISSSWPTSYGYLNVPPGPQTSSQSPGASRGRVPAFPPLPQGPASGASYVPDDYPPDSSSLPGYRGAGAQSPTSYPGGADRGRGGGGQGYSQPLANLPNLPNLNYPGYQPDPGASSSAAYPPQRDGRPLPPRTPSPPPSAPSYAPSYAPASTYNLQPETLALIPYRTPMATSIEQLPLDRRERMVLLLIDGQRSISDLIRLTRRSEQELYAVLNHLRLLGLLAM